MHTTVTMEELQALTDVVKEYLTDLRGEILDTEDNRSKQELRYKEETLRVILAKLEREREAIKQFLKT